MLEALSRLPADPLLALSGLFKADTNPSKVDLGVGVYRDETGRTPVFSAVKRAELCLYEEQQTKAYVGPEGDLEFIDEFWKLVGGSRRMATGVQTVGGTGALHLAAEVLKRSGVRRIFLGLPTWPNHAAIFQTSGLEVVTYPFFDVQTQKIQAERMIELLTHQARPGDAVLFHAMCHNPTGAVMDDVLWQTLTTLVLEKRLFPLIDNAYQGFGAGIEIDAAPMQRLIDTVPEAIIAASASKSFGLYRERTGAVFVTSASKEVADSAKSHLVNIARASYSMPPDHGAAVVRTILSNVELRNCWKAELDSARQRIAAIRSTLARGLSALSPALESIATQQGMFSLLPLDERSIARLRSEFGIFMPHSGRINIAGLRAEQAPDVMKAILDCAS